jgi:hypothetical protein
MVVVQGQPQLLEVVRTLRPAGRLARGLYGRQEQRNKDANNGDHDQQLDKRKRLPSATITNHTPPPNL